jgi:hypothetical protein
VDPLVARVRSAFADALAAPPPMSLRGGNDVDSYDHPTPFDAAADTPTDAYLEQYAFWGLAHLDPASWRHYLPRLIEYALTHPDDPRMAVEALVMSLRPPDREPPRLASLTEEQGAAVTAFLEHMAFSDPPSPHAGDAQRALDEWWWSRR